MNCLPSLKLVPVFSQHISAAAHRWQKSVFSWALCTPGVVFICDSFCVNSVVLCVCACQQSWSVFTQFASLMLSSSSVKETTVPELISDSHCLCTMGCTHLCVYCLMHTYWSWQKLLPTKVKVKGGHFRSCGLTIHIFFSTSCIFTVYSHFKTTLALKCLCVSRMMSFTLTKVCIYFYSNRRSPRDLG